ncbi:MAG: hypothetical protein GC187_04235 [Alphaproteobacteria bacterium]|nr:hypothetical protein [Alphaproteobacteria bacterium]
MTARLFTAAFTAATLAAAAHAQLPPPPQDGVSADLDCGSIYISVGALSAGLVGEESREPFSARAHAAIRAHASANPPAAGQDDASYQAFLNDAVNRWNRGIASEMEQLQSLGGPSSPEGMAGFIRLGNIAWEAVQACDARYGHAPLPSLFSWMD